MPPNSVTPFGPGIQTHESMETIPFKPPESVTPRSDTSIQTYKQAYTFLSSEKKEPQLRKCSNTLACRRICEDFFPINDWCLRAQPTEYKELHWICNLLGWRASCLGESPLLSVKPAIIYCWFVWFIELFSGYLLSWDFLELISTCDVWFFTTPFNFLSVFLFQGRFAHESWVGDSFCLVRSGLWCAGAFVHKPVSNTKWVRAPVSQSCIHSGICLKKKSKEKKLVFFFLYL